jgi:nucleoside-diphosphate-sugar epimerase
MSPPFQRAAVLGAAGAVGRRLVPLLLAAGTRVRVIGRNERRLRRAFADADVEIHPASAFRAPALREALDGCDLVFDCIGTPLPQIIDHPYAAETLARVLRPLGVGCIKVSSFWSYLPVRHLPVTEEHPRYGGNALIRARREAEDILTSAGATVANLPDLFGPHVNGVLQQALADAAARHPMRWIGSSRISREYLYVDDAARLLLALAEAPETGGRRWVFPGAGGIDGRTVARLVGDTLQRRVVLRTAPWWLLRIAAPFSRNLRDFGPMLSHYARPISYDASELQRRLGNALPPLTPYPDAIARTLGALTA